MLTPIQLSLIRFIQGNKPFFFKNAFKDIFSWRELNQLLNSPLINYDRFNVIGKKRFATMPKEEKPISKISEWQLDKTVIGPTNINEYIKMNVCYINDCSRVNYKINEIAEKLEYFSGQACDAHVFFSLKDRQEDTDGLGMHSDGSNNFIIQIEGSTHFTVENEFEVVLNPGDCVYVPIKVKHKARSLEKRLSISFPMDPRQKLMQDRFWIDF